MVYKTEQDKMGLTITIGPHRKHGNGAVGGGRQHTSGKKAVISKEGEGTVVLTGSTVSALLKDVRKQFKIPPHIRIHEKGETSI